MPDDKAGPRAALQPHSLSCLLEGNALDCSEYDPAMIVLLQLSLKKQEPYLKKGTVFYIYSRVYSQEPLGTWQH